MTNSINAIILSVVVAAGSIESGHAALVQYWNFDGYTGGTSVTATTGGGTLTASGGTITSVTGTGVNQTTPVDAAPAQALQIAGDKQNTPTLLIQFSRSGNLDFVLTYASIYTGNYSSHQWSWSTNGTAWNTFANVTGSTGWTTHTVDFSSVSALEQSGVTTIWFRDQVSYTGAGNNSSTVAFDNIQVTAVPEKSTIAAGIFGLLFAGTALTRKLLARRA